MIRRKDFMKRFCGSLRERTNRIIHFKKRRMIPITNKELKSYENAKICYIC